MSPRIPGALLCLSLMGTPGLSACTASAASPVAKTVQAPAQVTEIPGSDVKKVTFTPNAAAAVGVATAPVSSGTTGQPTVPYAAVIYYLDGTTCVYSVPAEREYVRVPITVASISGEEATLVTGPAVGTQVVVVGAAEILGAELQIDGEQ